VESADDAAKESEKLGFPVMLKGTLDTLPSSLSIASTNARQQPVVAEAWVS
jgi:hypothetical protein